jgi:hypothetical protein
MHYKEICDREFFIHVTEHGKVKVVGYYKTLNDFLRRHKEEDLAKGHYKCNLIENDDSWFLRTLSVGERYYNRNNRCRLYDEQGNFMAPDRLVGYHRDYRYERYKSSWSYRYYWPTGYKRNWRKGGGYHRMKTTQERRMACSEEHAPFVRGKRTARSLPNAWDDHWRDIQFNWKKTRKTQYRTVDKKDA